MSDAIAYATIRELGVRYRQRELSPVEVTRTLLGRIEQLDPMLHAFITLTADRAMADARAAGQSDFISLNSIERTLIQFGI